jgi:hypothetical protein
MANEYLVARMETVRPVLNEMYEADSKATLYGQISDKIDEHKIVKTPNGADFRIPMEIKPPGQVGALNLAGGAFSTGTPGELKQMYQSYFASQLAFYLNLEEIFNSSDQAKSTVNAFDRVMAQAPKRLAAYNDTALHSMGAGNQGLIAKATGYDTTVYTLETEYGANLLVEGQQVEILTSNLGSLLTAAVPTNLPYVTEVNKALGTVKMANLGAISPNATDYLAFPGVTASPAWSNGIRYFHTTAVSGNLLGLSLADYPEIRPNAVNASSASLLPTHLWQLTNKIKQRRGSVGDILGTIHTAQAYQWAELGLAISEWSRGKADEMIDVAPKVSDFVTMAGVRHFVDPHQSKSRVDWLNLKFWHRVYLNGVKADFYKQPGTGEMVFPVYNSSAKRIAAIEFHLVNSENIGCSDPGSGGFVYGLAIPSGF